MKLKFERILKVMENYVAERDSVRVKVDEINKNGTLSTLGKNGEFPIYNGSTIELEMVNEKYEYNDAITIAFKAMSASSGANDGLSLEGLQALTVESYSSANEISDEKQKMMENKQRVVNNIYDGTLQNNQIFDGFLLISSINFSASLPVSVGVAAINNFPIDNTSINLLLYYMICSNI